VNLLLPGSTIGVLGSGQLGRMLALAARRMGYRTVVFSPAADTPAGRAADREFAAEYGDQAALREFAGTVDVVTVEFENIPVSALEALEAVVPVRPGPATLYHTQNRAREKAFLAANAIPHVASATVDTPEEFDDALELLGTPAVLKTAGFGYDGKGQLPIRSAGDRAAALSQLREAPGVLETFVEFRRELSVVVARAPSGEMRAYPPIENRHRLHVLDVSSAPAGCGLATARLAGDIAFEVAEALEAVGVLCVEFFETAGGDLLVNEIAPRPHNSGHLTIEACTASQFEQQLRAIAGLPLADTDLVSPAAMANLLGDIWLAGEPDWGAVLAHRSVALHLYGKEEARPGRKMGHLTALAQTPERALAEVRSARAAAEGSRGEGR
jgi:5-(carboxyamino)imidazole ribonucleotide synthase